MAVISGILVRPANPGDRDELASLIYNEISIHRHLDWRTPLDWIGYSPFQILELKGKIAAVLACPPDPPGIAWIRVFAANDSILLQDAWELLWSSVLSSIIGIGENKISAITLQNWFCGILETSGFITRQKVVMLNWAGNIIPEIHARTEIHLRDMREADIFRVEQVDAAAFDPLWRNTASALRKAFGQAALATVALMENEIVGYQISTSNPLGGHLARLAVLPPLHGRGIGHYLVTDMIQKLSRTGVRSITVNTQNDNLRSLGLYKKIGFNETGESFPVYEFDVK
jgi:ribosomal protein S18 acetylase RimI-like enzyme